jgi:hypothetical protein
MEALVGTKSGFGPVVVYDLYLVEAFVGVEGRKVVLSGEL